MLHCIGQNIVLFVFANPFCCCLSIHGQSSWVSYSVMRDGSHHCAPPWKPSCRPCAPNAFCSKETIPIQFATHKGWSIQLNSFGFLRRNMKIGWSYRRNFKVDARIHSHIFFFFCELLFVWVLVVGTVGYTHGRELCSWLLRTFVLQHNMCRNTTIDFPRRRYTHQEVVQIYFCWIWH